MSHLKICFIGIGSIAKRHIKNLRDVCGKQNIQIDAFRRENVPINGVDNIYTDFINVPDDYDAIFITDPTEYHLETLKRFHDKGKHFFIEKPVVSVHQINEAKKLKLKENSVYYVAAPLRYNAVIQWVKDNINPEDVISIRSISSSYLPDWRPNQDYRKNYSAHKDMGGGVSIDLIHEWDYLIHIFDWPERVNSFIGKKSQLEIDSDDFAIYIAEYADKILELHLDYFGRKTIRELQIFTENETIIGDIANNQIKFLCTGKTIDFHEDRNDYQKRELIYFLNKIQQITHLQEITRALDVLNLTQGILPKKRGI